MSATRSDVQTGAGDLQEAAARIAHSAESVPAAVVPAAAGQPPGSQQGDVWIESLRSTGRRHNDAIGQLYELMLRAARFELSRRRSELSRVAEHELTDITLKAAADALESVLAHLDDFRGTSRFTTWASKFAVIEASIRFRRLAWQDREIALDDRGDGLPETLREAIADALSPQERRVFVSVALSGVPIDVLAERLDTTRGALHASLQCARRKLRSALASSPGA